MALQVCTSYEFSESGCVQKRRLRNLLWYKCATVSGSSDTCSRYYSLALSSRGRVSEHSQDFVSQML